MDENIKKFKLIRNVVLIAFLVILLSSLRLQIIEGKKYYRLSEKNRIRQRYIPAARGKIFDRRGQEIANTRPGFFVSAIQSLIDENALKEIAHILEIDERSIREKLRMEKNPFMAVKIAHDIRYEQLSVIEEGMDLLKGIEVGVEPLRNYPHKELFCHLIGYVGEITHNEITKNKGCKIDDYIGRMGIEEYCEGQLRGTDGVEYIEVDARGRELGKIAEKRPLSATPGKDIYTTIDLALTESVSVYLEDFENAACVCLNPQNGEIYVLYSKPGFDPNHFVHGLQKKEWQMLHSRPDAPMYNRAIMSCYPCGSAFKPFVALAALDAKMITPEKSFTPCFGKYRLGRRIFKCWKRHGRLKLVDAIVYSCDIYFYQLGALVGVDTIVSRAREIGFGKKTGIDLPGEKAGFLPDRTWFESHYGDNWTLGHIFNLSIGQGDLLVTPLQVACAYSVFANDGKIPLPHVIRRNEHQYRETTISEEAIATVEQGMKGVVSSGTGTLADVANFEVCGKTGTVQNPHGEDHSLFVGYAPCNDPQILLCVFVENAGHGGSVAAPIAGKIFRAFMQLNTDRDYVQEN